jgi:hypothetical protein
MGSKVEPRRITWVPGKVPVLQATEAPQACVLSHALAVACFCPQFSPWAGESLGEMAAK